MMHARLLAIEFGQRLQSALRQQPFPDFECRPRSADNVVMPLMPTGLVNQGQLNREVKKAVARLSTKEVVRVRHSVGVDSTGEPALFFRIVLTDSASKEDALADVTGRISETLFDVLRPYDWGLIPYFNFRSKSEQDKRNEPEWA